MGDVMMTDPPLDHHQRCYFEHFSPQLLGLINFPYILFASSLNIGGTVPPPPLPPVAAPSAYAFSCRVPYVSVTGFE